MDSVEYSSSKSLQDKSIVECERIEWQEKIHVLERCRVVVRKRKRSVRKELLMCRRQRTELEKQIGELQERIEYHELNKIRQQNLVEENGKSLRKNRERLIQSVQDALLSSLNDSSTTGDGKAEEDELRRYGIQQMLDAFVMESLALEHQDTDDSLAVQNRLRAMRGTCLDFRILSRTGSMIDLENILVADDDEKERLDPNVPLCPFELNGVCSDVNCSYQHLDLNRPARKIIPKEILPLPKLDLPPLRLRKDRGNYKETSLLRDDNAEDTNEIDSDSRIDNRLGKAPEKSESLEADDYQRGETEESDAVQTDSSVLQKNLNGPKKKIGGEKSQEDDDLHSNICPEPNSGEEHGHRNQGMGELDDDGASRVRNDASRHQDPASLSFHDDESLASSIVCLEQHMTDWREIPVTITNNSLCFAKTPKMNQDNKASATSPPISFSDVADFVRLAIHAGRLPLPKSWKDCVDLLQKSTSSINNNLFSPETQKELERHWESTQVKSQDNLFCRSFHVQRVLWLLSSRQQERNFASHGAKIPEQTSIRAMVQEHLPRLEMLSKEAIQDDPVQVTLFFASRLLEILQQAASLTMSGSARQREHFSDLVELFESISKVIADFIMDCSFHVHEKEDNMTLQLLFTPVCAANLSLGCLVRHYDIVQTRIEWLMKFVGTGQLNWFLYSGLLWSQLIQLKICLPSLSQLIPTSRAVESGLVNKPAKIAKTASPRVADASIVETHKVMAEYLVHLGITVRNVRLSVRHILAEKLDDSKENQKMGQEEPSRLE